MTSKNDTREWSYLVIAAILAILFLVEVVYATGLYRGFRHFALHHPMRFVFIGGFLMGLTWGMAIRDTYWSVDE